MNTKPFDVAVIGAGAAGLIAALEIALTGKTVAVIEAKDRTGGRIFTINPPEFEKPVELGAEFVHGKLPVTLGLFEKAGIKKVKSGGEVWQYKNGELQEQDDFIEDFKDLEKKFKSLDHDLSVANFMRHYLAGEKYEKLRFSLKNYVQGYYAGDIERASTYALCEELTTGEEENYRVEGGYQKMLDYLDEQCVANGVQFYLSERVNEVKWKPGNVEIVTDGQTLFSRKVLVTVSIGVLQSESIRFSPALSQKITAAKSLGFGHVVKIILSFSEAFWKEEFFTKGKDLSKLGFLFSEEALPTWWTQHPEKEALLTGWLSGPPAEACIQFTKDEMLQRALRSLSRIFSVEPSVLQEKLKGVESYNWSADKDFCGAYSYNVINGEAFMKTILEPAEETIYFAGEGLHYGNEIGTVEAALTSGRNIAHQLIAHFSSPK